MAGTDNRSGDDRDDVATILASNRVLAVIGGFGVAAVIVGLFLGGFAALNASSNERQDDELPLWGYVLMIGIGAAAVVVCWLILLVRIARKQDPPRSFRESFRDSLKAMWTGIKPMIWRWARDPRDTRARDTTATCDQCGKTFAVTPGQRMTPPPHQGLETGMRVVGYALDALSEQPVDIDLPKYCDECSTLNEAEIRQEERQRVEDEMLKGLEALRREGTINQDEFERRQRDAFDITGTARWHRDPTGRHGLRYWDGCNWTDVVSDPDGTKTTDPIRPSDPTGSPSA